jgi:hypothetical protein
MLYESLCQIADTPSRLYGFLLFKAGTILLRSVLRLRNFL